MFEKKGSQGKARLTGAAGCSVRLVGSRISGVKGAKAAADGTDSVLFIEQDEQEICWTVLEDETQIGKEKRR